MNVYDNQSNLLGTGQYDLSKGYLSPQTIINPEATPIDNIQKFAWADEDYIEVAIYIPYSEEDLANMNTPTADDDRDSMLVDLEYRVTLLELGLEGGNNNAVQNP